MDLFYKKLKRENKELRELLTESWKLMDRATLIFGKNHDHEYCLAWEKYRETEKRCEVFIGERY